MDRGVYAIVSGAMAQERRMDVVSNNLTNVQTVGFKRDKPLFKTLFSKTLAGEAKAHSKTDKVFTHWDANFLNWKGGSIRPTGNPLDVALEGDGLFAVQGRKGVEYTRSGNFVLNDKRQLSTRDGAVVLGQSGPMTVPVGKMLIDDRGEVSVSGATVDTLKVVKFKDLSSVTRVGDRFISSNGVAPAPSAKVVHEALEDSNVNAVEELASLVEISRYYEAAQKVIQSMDDAARKAANDIAGA